MKGMNFAKISCFIIIIFQAELIFSACKNPIPRPVQIEGNSFILAIGIDKGIDNPENVRLTVLSPKTDIPTGKGGQQEATKQEVATVEGKTLFDATRNLKALQHKNYFWGHIRYVFIGQEAASENILSFTDMLIRDHDIRLSMLVFVTKGDRAEKLLKLGEKLNLYLPDVFKGLVENIGGLSISKEVKLSSLICTFDNPYLDAYIPYVSIINKDKTYVTLNGFAIFKRMKLIDFISDKTARGLNWVTGNVKSGCIVIKDKDNKDITLEIIDSDSKLKSSFNNGNSTVTINILTSANVVEQKSQKNIYTEEQIADLEDEFRKEVYKEVENIVNIARSNNVDILGISDEIYHKHPLRWKEIKNNWNTIFTDIKIDINVEAKINRTYLLKEPIGTDRGK